MPCSAPSAMQCPQLAHEHLSLSLCRFTVHATTRGVVRHQCILVHVVCIMGVQDREMHSRCVVFNPVGSE